jgi:hypothetical protein
MRCRLSVERRECAEVYGVAVARYMPRYMVGGTRRDGLI